MIETTKETNESGVTYARRALLRAEADGEFTAASVAVEKCDPILTPASVPASVPVGSDVALVFTLIDFDGAPRDESGEVVFSVGGVAVARPLIGGTTSITLELHESVTISLLPPFVGDMRMKPITIEVTT